MYEVWLGKLELRSAMRSGRVQVSGASPVVRQLSDIFELSPIADRVAAVTRG